MSTYSNVKSANSERQAVNLLLKKTSFQDKIVGSISSDEDCLLHYEILTADLYVRMVILFRGQEGFARYTGSENVRLFILTTVQIMYLSETSL